MSNVKPIPEGYHTVTPYIAVKDAAAALDFYQRAFGAEVLSRFDANGKVMHAEMKLGDSRVMLSDELPDWGLRAPTPVQGVTSSLMFYCADVDAVHARAVAAGATALSPVADAFHGDRTGTVLCPFGHRWSIATHIEDVSPDELKRRVDAWMASTKAS